MARTLLLAFIAQSFLASTALASPVIDFAAIKSPHATYACGIVISSSESNPSYDPHSSASLIGNTHAVTASHNFDSARARLALKEGRLFLSCPGQPRALIRAAYLAPSYRGCSYRNDVGADSENDVAVLLTEPTQVASRLNLATSTQIKELKAANRCGFLGYSPLVCELSPARFPESCERKIDTKTLLSLLETGKPLEKAKAFQSTAVLDAGDSGSGLVCYNRSGAPNLLAVNMAATVGRTQTMYSTSVAYHHSFVATALALSDLDFSSQAKKRLAKHASWCP